MYCRGIYWGFTGIIGDITPMNGKCFYNVVSMRVRVCKHEAGPVFGGSKSTDYSILGHPKLKLPERYMYVRAWA